MISTFRLSTLLIIIQLRLNTDEYPIISMMFFFCLFVLKPLVSKTGVRMGIVLIFAGMLRGTQGQFFVMLLRLFSFYGLFLLVF